MILGLNTKIYKNKIKLKVIEEGFIEGNKGVHVENRNLELKFLNIIYIIII